MQVPLDSITQARLAALAERRRRLVRRRGLAATLLTVMAALTAAAAVDRVFILSDDARWMLSAAVYLLVGAGAWRYWVRPARRAPDWQQLARFIETARPELREDLLSAVELGGAGSDAALDSPEFRALLQASVAERMRGIDAIDLLPPRLIRWWVALAGVAGIVFIGLLIMREVHFGILVARALLPMANIERVSNTRLTVVEPTPPDATVPQGDGVLVRVRCAGPVPERATLELFRAGRARESIPMIPAGQGPEFQAGLTTDEHVLEYRIRAGDGLTRRYTITPRVRPYVAEFEIVYQPPPYLHRPDQRLAPARRGDLAALAGSTAQLVMRTDQPVSRAELEMEQEGHFSRVPVQQVEANRLTASIPIKAGGEYKISLVSAETGFDNGRFSPRYEIKALVDQSPAVRLIEPGQDQLAPAHEIIPLAGEAADDVGLARVTHLVSINDQPWRELSLPVSATLPAEAGLAVAVRTSWDLAPLGLKPGDRVATKLVATDLKGGVGESTTIRLLIASERFSPSDTRLISAQRGIFELLRQFENLTATTARSAREIAQGLNPEDRSALAESARRLRSAATRLEEEAKTLQDTIAAAAANAEGGADAWELTALGAAIALVQRESAHGAIELADAALVLGTADKARDVFQRAADALEQSTGEMRAAREMYGEILISDETALISLGLIELQNEQERIDRLGRDDESARRRRQRRQETAIAHFQQVEMQLNELAERYGAQTAEPARATASRLARIREGLARELSASDGQNAPPAGATGPMQQLLEARATWPSFDAAQAERAAQQRGRLEAALPPFERLISQLTQRTREWAAQNRQTAERSARGDTPEEMRGDTARLLELHLHRKRQWNAVVELLGDLARLEEARSDHDPVYAADVDLMRRVLKTLYAAEVEGEATAKLLEKVNPAFKTLQVGHGPADLSILTAEIRDQERWRFAAAESSTRSPQAVEFAQLWFNALPDRFPPGGLPGGSRDRLLRIRDGASWREVVEQMSRRRRTLDPATRVQDKLERVAEEVADLNRGIQWRMEQARKVLRDCLPPISELAAGLAEKAEQLRHGSLSAAADLETHAPEANTQTLSRLRSGQEELSSDIRDLQDSLRRQANLEDLSTEAGRENARDADDEVALLREPLENADRAMAAAAAAPERIEQTQRLAQAADHEGTLADALRRIARHEKLAEVGADLSASRAELRAAEAQLGMAASMDRQYEAAERMAELARGDPEQVLQGLEQELSRNQAMGEALEAVARESIDQARSRLRQASQQEGRIVDRLQPSAANENERRDALARRLEQVGQRAANIAQSEFPPTRERSRQAQVPAEGRFEAAERSVAAAHQAASDNATEPIGELAADAKDTAAKLTEAAENMRRASEAARQTAAGAQRAGAKGQSQAQNAQQVAREAAASGEQLKNLAQEARQIAQEAGQRTPVPRELTNSQEPVTRNVQAAGDAMERAAQLEDRVGSPQLAQSLQRLAEEVEATAKHEIAGAAAAVRTQGAGQAHRAVQEARAAIDAHLAQMDAAAEAAARSAQGPQNGADDAAAEAMARALARLSQADAQRAEGRRAEDFRAAGAEATALLRAASTTMARAMRQTRASGQPHRSRAVAAAGLARASKSGAVVESPANPPATPLPNLDSPSTDDTWGKLPPKLAADLMAGRKESVAEEYRDRVDRYFKVIAEKAKGNTP